MLIGDGVLLLPVRASTLHLISPSGGAISLSQNYLERAARGFAHSHLRQKF